MMKCLVISLAGIGDTLMATPLIHELRANFPTATIDALVMWPGSRDLLSGNPHLNSIHHCNLIRGSKLETLRFLSTLRRCRYDVSMNTFPQSKTEYRAVAWWIGAHRRFSHRYDRWNWLDSLLVHSSTPQDYGLHAAENNLNLLKLFPVGNSFSVHNYELFLTAEELRWAQDYIAGDSRPVLGVHVGSGTTKNLPLRRWPIERWVALFRRVLEAHPNVRIFLFGGPEEAEDHQEILTKFQDERLIVPATKNLRQAAALIGRCVAFISVDTALMHIAAAMKVPRQIVIETPTFNKTVEPYHRPFVLVPNPMVAGRNLDYYRYDGRGIQGDPEHLRACMRSVTVEAVFAQVTKALSN